MNDNMTQPKTSVRNMVVGNGCILLATIFFGVNIPVVKELVPRWMNADAVTAVRLVGGCVLMWIASLFVKCAPIKRDDWLPLVLGGAVGLFSFMYLFNLSLRFADPIDVSIVMTLPPMFVVLYQIIFRHARPALLEYAGMALAFVGAVLVIVVQHGSAGSNNLLGLLLALGSTIAYAFYLVVMEGPSKRYHPVTTLRWSFLFSAIPALLCLPSLIHSDLVTSSAPAVPWIEIAFILLCPTFLSYFLISPADRLIGSELVSIYQYLLPVVAAVASVIMGISHIIPLQIIAMAIIIAGMVLTNLGKHRRLRSY
ncbi:MAG: DMT family transporter [Odoribacter sp.]|nr:DMT family transporter [Odoribacter sp.]